MADISSIAKSLIPLIEVVNNSYAALAAILIVIVLVIWMAYHYGKGRISVLIFSAIILLPLILVALVAILNHTESPSPAPKPPLTTDSETPSTSVSDIHKLPSDLETQIIGCGEVFGLRPADGDGFLAVRKKAKTNSTQIASLLNFNKVKIYKRDGNWLEINYSKNNKEIRGWAHRRWIKDVPCD